MQAAELNYSEVFRIGWRVGNGHWKGISDGFLSLNSYLEPVEHLFDPICEGRIHCARSAVTIAHQAMKLLEQAIKLLSD